MLSELQKYAFDWVFNTQQGFAFIWYHWTLGCGLPCVSLVKDPIFVMAFLMAIISLHWSLNPKWFLMESHWNEKIPSTLLNVMILCSCEVELLSKTNVKCIGILNNPAIILWYERPQVSNRLIFMHKYLCRYIISVKIKIVQEER